MKPISFKELGEKSNYIKPGPAEIRSKNPASCPARGVEATTKKSGIPFAECGVLSAICGRSVAVDADTCKVCMCNGEPNVMTNKALQKHVLQVAYSSCIAGYYEKEAKHPSAEEVSIAIDNIKKFADDEVALRFIDSLVYNESIDIPTAESLIEKKNLSRVDEETL